tara:strand:+ start:265 stop:708 length:444 start_codon:yes stop_codon:yes gene_type:complete
MLRHTLSLLCILILITFFAVQHEKVKNDILLETFKYDTPDHIIIKDSLLTDEKPSQQPQQDQNQKESTCETKFQMPYQLSHPSKCFSCEKQMAGTNDMYLAEPGKCFDCENQMIDTLGPSYALYGQSTKCFSCEKQPAVWGTYPSIQ